MEKNIVLGLKNTVMENIVDLNRHQATTVLWKDDIYQRCKNFAIFSKGSGTLVTNFCKDYAVKLVVFVVVGTQIAVPHDKIHKNLDL